MQMTNKTKFLYEVNCLASACNTAQNMTDVSI